MFIKKILIEIEQVLMPLQEINLSIEQLGHLKTSVFQCQLLLQLLQNKYKWLLKD